MENLFRKNYLTKNALERLKNFKYQGDNSSIVYNYLVSPFLEKYFMWLIPLWVAPNLISLLSFVFNFITFIVIQIEAGGDYSVKLSRMCLGMKAFSHLMYILLDNADGKQARRTNTCSPLGLLLDHGLDALTTVITAYNCSFICSFGNESILSYILFLSLYFGYYIINYEEYRTGKMILGIINGADEGNFIIFSIASVCFIMDTNYLSSKIYSTISLGAIMVVFVALGTINCLIEFMVRMMRNNDFLTEIKIIICDCFWITHALFLPIAFYFANKEFYFANMSFFIAVVSLIFLRISIEMLINIVCKRTIRRNNMVIFVTIFLDALLFSKLLHNEAFVNVILYILYGLTTILFAELIKFLILVTHEIKTYLGLSLLTIDYKRD